VNGAATIPTTAAEDAMRDQRAAAHRAAPYWPFGRLTPMQMAQRAAQEAAMRHHHVARYPEGMQ